MSTLLTHSNALMRALLADPLTRLAMLSAWLDPLGGEANDPFLEGVRSVCACFPDLYPDVVAFLHASPPLIDTLEQVVCQHVQAQGIPLESLEGIGYGIPLPAYGTRWFTGEEDTLPPVLLPLLVVFGVDASTLTYPDDAPILATLLMIRFHAHPDPLAQSLGSVVGWLWGVTGNVCVDCDDERLYEYDPLGWTPHEIALAQEVIAEADTLMSAVEAGCTALSTHPHLLRPLERAVHRARTLYHAQLTQQKGQYLSHDTLIRLARRIRLDARAFTTQPDRNPPADAGVLPLWHPAPPTHPDGGDA